MTSLIDRRDMDFLLEWLDVEALLRRPRYAMHTRATFDAVVDLSDKLAASAFLPAFKPGDRHEPELVDGRVVLSAEIRAAVLAYGEAGLYAAPFDEALGGMQLPATVHYASIAHFMAASLAASAFPMLTIANARLIAAFGTPAQVAAFAQPQMRGESLGTMCLSEPQAGSSLSDIRTLARPDGEDALGHRYRLTGNKMWISGGDHDITGDIVHLVLAKTPDAGGAALPGVKGISLFIVPKRLPDGQANDVSVAGLNHKMGYRGISNCLLNFGEGGQRPGGAAGAIGWRVGEVGQGIAQMFQMMNEARTSVGLGAAAAGYRAYRLSVDYARGRIQGRIRRDGDAAPSPAAIIEHPDVRRMLLAQKAYAEGGLALALYGARLIDEAATADADGAADAHRLLDLLTPVIKTWPSEYGLAANDLAIQVHGGYGYTRDYDVEQLYRDNRLNPIHEGTTGIQAQDLLGRKVLRGDGRAMAALGTRIARTLSSARARPEMRLHAGQLELAWSQLLASARALAAVPADRVLDDATCYLRAFGHIVVAWLWLDMALFATGTGAHHRGKRLAMRYFYEQELPLAQHWLRIVNLRSGLCHDADPDAL